MKITGIRRHRLRGDTPSGQHPTVRPRTRMRAVSPRVRERITRVVVDVGNRASAWRDAATDAELAYRWWKTAPPVQRGDAGAGYLAAIEREEKAAAEYSRALEVCRTTVP
jgi:transposase